MLDLQDRLDASGLGWDLYDAQGINDAGQIIGRGFYEFGGPFGRAFLLTPVVPEPAAIMLALPLIAATALRRGGRARRPC